MTLAIKIGDDTSAIRGLIYFDVVTKFSEDVSGDVSSFPLDMGASVSDHYSAKNPTFQIQGLLSAADVTGESFRFSLDGSRPINSKAQPRTPSILDFSVGVSRLLPGSATQFFKKAVPEVIDGGSALKSDQHVKDLLRELMTGVRFNSTLNRYQNNSTLVTIFELDNGNIVAQHKDLVITHFSIDEDPDTGDCIPLSLTLERVRFAFVEKVEAKKKPQTRKTAKKGSKSPVKQECTAANGQAQGAQSVAGEPRFPALPSINNPALSFNTLKNWTPGR